MITRGIIRLLERTGKITERDRENDEGRRGKKRNRKGDERRCEMRVIRSEEEGRKKKREREEERREEKTVVKPRRRITTSGFSRSKRENGTTVNRQGEAG